MNGESACLTPGWPSSKGRYESVQPKCQQCGGCAHVGLTWKTVTRDHNRVSKFARSDTHPLVALAHSWQEHGVPSGRAQNLPPKTLMPRILHAARGKHTHNQVRVVVLCWGVASDEQLEQGDMSAKLSTYTLNPLVYNTMVKEGVELESGPAASDRVCSFSLNVSRGVSTKCVFKRSVGHLWGWFIIQD